MKNYELFVDAQLLINRYFNALDSRDYETLLNCLTEDVDWQVSSIRAGRSDVAKAMAERPEHVEVRHLVTNLDVCQDGDAADAFFLLSTFVHFRTEGSSVPYPISPPVIVADMRAHLVQGPSGLQMRKLLAQIIFKQPDWHMPKANS
jgi:hypothetical protein